MNIEHSSYRRVTKFKTLSHIWHTVRKLWIETPGCYQYK